jgi:hypothetical protein
MPVHPYKGGMVLFLSFQNRKGASFPVSIIATYVDPHGATSSEPWRTLMPSPSPTPNPTPTSTPTPTPTPTSTPQEDDCVVESITVGWQAGSGPVKSVKAVSVMWQITIKGKKLKKCEFTQFISANTQLWDAAGKELTKDDVLAAYKASNIGFRKGAGAFTKNEKDGGWGKGEAWEDFKNDNEVKKPDRHTFLLPFYMSGTEKKYYAYRIERDMVVKVRKKRGPVLKEEEWSYVLRNYSEDLPTAPLKPKMIGDSMIILQTLRIF